MLRQLVVQDHVEKRWAHADAPVVFDKTHFRNRFMKKLTRDRVVPMISARVLCVMAGIKVSGSPGLRIPRSAAKCAPDVSRWNSRADRSDPPGSSYSEPAGISGTDPRTPLFAHHLDHLCTFDSQGGAGGDGGGRCHAQTPMPASDSSPAKSPAPSRVIVASFPFFDMTLSLARPF